MDAKTLCLGVLTLGDRSGYEIKKYLEDGPISHFHETSFGSIYPALGKLSREGLVTWRAVPQEGRPDKKVYSVTEDGVAAFRAALREQPGGDKHKSDTMTFLFFSELMDAARRREVFEAHLGDYRELLERWADLDFSHEPAHRRFIHRMGIEIYRTIVDYMEAHGDELFEDDGEAGR